ncbi:hypothetical protein QE152_g8630 [Popillia japonica]|uniref:Uncharacterized protein n=1 Tax=Popillia japonica TaxID=7064 RepID=A0AAW1M2X2_POPJA
MPSPTLAQDSLPVAFKGTTTKMPSPTLAQDSLPVAFKATQRDIEEITFLFGTRTCCEAEDNPGSPNTTA